VRHDEDEYGKEVRNDRGHAGRTSDSGPNDVVEDEENEEFYDTSMELVPSASLSSSFSGSSIASSLSDIKSSNPLRKRRRRLLNTALEAYNNSPALKYGVEIMERATQPMVNIIEQTSLEWKRKRRLNKANKMFPDDVREYTLKHIGKTMPLVRSSLSSSFVSGSGGESDGSSVSESGVAVDMSSSSVLESLYAGDINDNSKKQTLPSISEALAIGNELSLNMSIESRKRLNTCLQLLMLANKQLSSKIIHLQDLVNKEQELIRLKQKKRKQRDGEDNVKSTTDNEGDEVFHDASDLNTTNEIKQEIVGTVKKVVTFISKYAGKSLAEPERSNVRRELLKLPNKWATQASSSILGYDTNGKVLVLAHESLEMVGSVMSVFDESLAKAEIWIKRKQEKQLARQAVLNNTLKKHREKQ
jgi:bZIP factor